MTLAHELEKLIGLQGESTLTQVRELSLGRVDVGLGFAPTGAVWNELADDPSWQALGLGAPLDLDSWQEQEGVFRASLPSPGQLKVLRGVARQVDERTVHADARSEDVVLQASLESGDEVVLCLERTSCRFFRVQRVLEVPELTAFTGGLEGETWLSKEYGELAGSPSAVDRVAAVGLLLRLWQPTTAEARKRVLQQTMASGSALLAEARRWAAQLSPAMCSQCAEAAEVSAEVLEEELNQLERAAERSPLACRGLATYVALERDRLESIFAVLALRGDVSPRRGALERLDEQASLRLGQLASAGVEHPLLERTAEAEPFAWWGAIAVS